MNWIHSSRISVVFAILALLTVAAAPVAAVTASVDGLPDETAVASEVSSTFTITEPYKNPNLEQWTLYGETHLENVTWTVTLYDQTGAKVDGKSYDGANFTHEGISANSGIAEISVKVVGTAPAVSQYTYATKESFTVTTLQQVRQGGTSNEIGSWSTHHYTAESKNARQAIDSAEAAIASANADTTEAETLLENAITAYEDGSFDLASDLASQSEEKATSAKQSKEQSQLLLYAVGGIIALLVLIGGGYFLYQSQQDGYDKLG